MKLQQKPDDVCPQDCPERTSTCHGTCKRYLNWHEKKKQEYRHRIDEVDVNSYVNSAYRNCRHKPPRIIQRYKRK